MDKKDAWLLELYEGSGKPSDPGSGNTEEAASLREMKDWLDARSAIRSARPDPEAVEAVLQAAAQSAQPAGARQNRPALSRKRVVWRLPRRIAGGAIAAMLAVVAIVGLFRADVFAPALTDSEPVALRPDASVSTEAVPAEASPETLSPAGEAEDRGADVQPGNAGLAAAPSPDLPASAGAPPSETAVEAPSPTVLAGASSADAAGPLQSAAAASEQAEDGTLAQPGFILVEIPAWDDQSDVISLQQRIRSIGDGVATGWETPAVPLEMLPAGSGNTGLTPASERR
ncbi:MAG: hypothetical protein F4Y00_07055 [Bacteroidetes bacterium SB0662_bin_6]|nr:hypothetical protein [Bacteroidetes bacterium SB0668_bin_1]MYE04710.1 hypothetical protein [Bacteroidetes bacterium SB0662_bin_6]